jgi:hypothetical protein
VDGKGLVVGLALIVAVLAVLFGVALADGTAPDDPSNNDCVSGEYC